MKLEIPKELIETIKEQIRKQLPFSQDLQNDIEISNVSIIFEVKLSAFMETSVKT